MLQEHHDIEMSDVEAARPASELSEDDNAEGTLENSQGDTHEGGPASMGHKGDPELRGELISITDPHQRLF